MMVMVRYTRKPSEDFMEDIELIHCRKWFLNVKIFLCLFAGVFHEKST